MHVSFDESNPKSSVEESVDDIAEVLEDTYLEEQERSKAQKEDQESLPQPSQELLHSNLPKE